MKTMVLQRFGIGVLTLLVVSVLVFAGTEILPGDVAEIVLGQVQPLKTWQNFAPSSVSINPPL